MWDYYFEFKFKFNLIHDSGVYHIDDLVQDYSISIANALEILQSCTKPSIL